MGSVSADRVVQGGGWGHTQGDMHIVAARLGFERAWTDLEHYFQLVEGWFLAKKAALAVPIVLTIACSLISGCGQSHESVY